MTETMPQVDDDAPLVDLLIEDSRWHATELPQLAPRAARAVLSALGISEAGFELCILGCDDARIATLNAGFRGRPAATNVLSWPATRLAAKADGGMPARPEPDPTGMPESLGDMALAYETCAAEAVARGIPLEAHLLHLLVHGMLHLLGYDHIRDKDAALMENTEVAILATLGVKDPYAAGALAPE